MPGCRPDLLAAVAALRADYDAYFERVEGLRDQLRPFVVSAALPPAAAAAGLAAVAAAALPASPCCVCLEAAADIVTLPCCAVTVCAGCLPPYLSAAAEDFRFSADVEGCVHCPTGCGGVVPDDVPAAVLTPDAMLRYRQLRSLWFEDRSAIEAAKAAQRDAEPFADDLSRHYLQAHCRQCPSCGSWVAKDDDGTHWHGCDKMTCRCGARWCFRCGRADAAGCRCTGDEHSWFSRDEVLAGYRMWDSVADMMDRLLGPEAVSAVFEALQSDGVAAVPQALVRVLAERPELPRDLMREIRGTPGVLDALRLSATDPSDTERRDLQMLGLSQELMQQHLRVLDDGDSGLLPGRFPAQSRLDVDVEAGA
eukprot:TRINITY_DN28489_c0_g1_i1.p1 TRINITY_DN28489_c0_g1~~TRINITY_DN28489_c0_g1_i1.p1  ORF type:complete len:384 (+),score=118.28 TRINITY_DN28489_c0_g1_i1:55-1152(+)